MITLLIEDVEVDVLQTEQIVTEYSVAPIGDISKRTGARSIQFKLPRTAKNRAVFEASELPISTSVKPYQRLKARLYVDGVDMNILFATLESVKDYYFIRVYGSNADFFNIIKDGKLADLNLDDLNHYWDFVTVRESRLNTEGYIYPLINWNDDNVVGATAREQSSRLLVSVYAETLLQRICRDAGYTLNNQLLNDTDYNYASIVVPYNAADYERDNNLRRLLGTFTMNDLPTGSPTGNLFFATAVTQQEQIYWQAFSFNSGGEFAIVDECELDFTVSMELFNISGVDETVSIDVYDTRSPSGYALVSTFSVTVPPTAITDPQFPFSFSETVRFVEQTVGLKRFGLVVRSISGSSVGTLNNPVLQITDVRQKLDANGEIDNQAKGVEWGATIDDYVTVANLLPDIKQSDFLKNFLQLHGAIVQVNEQLKTVTIAKFEQVLNNLGSAIDWTAKLDFIEEYETKFQLDYAQNNYLRYKDEDGVIKPDGTDSNLTVADENLEFEKDFITLDFGATETGVWFSNGNNTFTYNTPNIKVLESGLVAETTEPRLLYLKQIDGYTHTYRDGASQFDVNTSAPIAWFIDADFTHSLGFGSDLYERYYSFLEGILDRTKVIEAKIRLNTSDIAQLDFLKPVYIGELDAYFYVSKVKFDYTSNASSIVELVKLL